MAHNNDIRFKEADRVLRRNGFVCDRTRGSHHHYVNGDKSVVINIKTNRMVWKRICKEYGLVV